MLSVRKLKPYQIQEIMRIPESWIRMFGMGGLMRRFKTTRHLIEKEAKTNKLFADKIKTLYRWYN